LSGNQESALLPNRLLLKLRSLMPLQLNILLHTDKHSNYNKNVEFLPILSQYPHQYASHPQNTFDLMHNTFLLIYLQLKRFLFVVQGEFDARTQQTWFDEKQFLENLLKSDL